jgi:hypothetical protein
MQKIPVPDSEFVAPEVVNIDKYKYYGAKTYSKLSLFNTKLHTGKTLLFSSLLSKNLKSKYTEL